MNNSIIRLTTYCELTFDIGTPTPFIFMLRPRSGAKQWVSREEFIILPETVQVFEFTDHYGNLCQRLLAPPGILSILTKAEIKTTVSDDRAPGAAFVEIQTLPDLALHYLLPSRYCESDRLLDLAREITENQLPGYDQVASIEAWLIKNIAYIPGISEFLISAVEVYERKSGVCRDMAHLGIALCRSLSIPARMVVGFCYQLEPMDLHAWFEAFVGDRWYTFDAIQHKKKGGYVALGYGRDAGDVAIYNQFGPPVFPRNYIVQVEKINQFDH